MTNEPGRGSSCTARSRRSSHRCRRTRVRSKRSPRRPRASVAPASSGATTAVRIGSSSSSHACLREAASSTHDVHREPRSRPVYGVEQLVEHRFGIAEDADVDRVRAPDLGDVDVDLDDLRARNVVDLAGCASCSCCCPRTAHRSPARGPPGARPRPRPRSPSVRPGPGTAGAPRRSLLSPSAWWRRGPGPARRTPSARRPRPVRARRRRRRAGKDAQLRSSRLTTSLMLCSSGRSRDVTAFGIRTSPSTSASTTSSGR